MPIHSSIFLLASLVAAPLSKPAFGAVHSSAPAIAIAGPDSSLIGPGISRELAERRSAALSNVNYDLQLDVTRPDTALGHVTISVERSTGAPDDLILDFRGLAIDEIKANGMRVQVDKWNGAHVLIGSEHLRAGRNTIEIAFRTAIAPAGASIIKYHDSTDGSTYLYTLLVPADANLLFPCFDQPDLKARVTLDLTTPHGWRVVANGAVAGVDSSGAASIFRFAQSEPISTYLIAFAAGPWAVFESHEGTRPVKLFARQSRASEVEADTIIVLNQRALTWLEEYFGRPFPFSSFAMVLAPAFPFGGMEHPGAIFYNENSFIYRERPTLSQLIGREATIFHEVAHQWFGDLVTMKWFDDLWLKEGFATYMAAKMQDALSPEANAWKTFFLRNKPAAYRVDATVGTTPIWQELANLDQAKSNYGAIVYNKAPGVLKQLNYLVGDSAFQRGVREFLRQHAYANATWRDLLDAIGDAAGLSLDDWGEQYILRRGMPVIRQQALAGDKPATECVSPCITGVRLIQHPARDLGGSGVWPMRVEVLFALADSMVRLPVAITSETTLVKLPPGMPPAKFAFANSRDYGYALTQIDPITSAYLQAHIGEIEDDFLRAMLWESLWNMVRYDASLAPVDFISAALRELPHETDEQILNLLLGGVGRATEAYLSPEQRESRLRGIERALMALAQSDQKPYGIRKAAMDAFIGVAATPRALAILDATLDGDSVAGAPLRAPTRWAIITSLVEHSAPNAERRLRAESVADSTSEGRRRAFAAGAARPSASVKAEYWRRYFADSTLNEEWATSSLRSFNESSQSELTLPYLVPALDSLPWIQRNRRIFFLGSWIGAFMSGQHSAEALRRVDEFLSGHPNLPADLRQKIEQSADELRRTVAIRRRYDSPPAS
jgi:aminopeptidase N